MSGLETGLLEWKYILFVFFLNTYRALLLRSQFFLQWRSLKNFSELKTNASFRSSPVSNMYDVFQNFAIQCLENALTTPTTPDRKASPRTGVE